MTHETTRLSDNKLSSTDFRSISGKFIPQCIGGRRLLRRKRRRCKSSSVCAEQNCHQAIPSAFILRKTCIIFLLLLVVALSIGRCRDYAESREGPAWFLPADLSVLLLYFRLGKLAAITKLQKKKWRCCCCYLHSTARSNYHWQHAKMGLLGQNYFRSIAQLNEVHFFVFRNTCEHAVINSASNIASKQQCQYHTYMKKKWRFRPCLIFRSYR